MVEFNEEKWERYFQCLERSVDWIAEHPELVQLMGASVLTSGEYGAIIRLHTMFSYDEQKISLLKETFKGKLIERRDCTSETAYRLVDDELQLEFHWSATLLKESNGKVDRYLK